MRSGPAAPNDPDVDFLPEKDEPQFAGEDRALVKEVQAAVKDVSPADGKASLFVFEIVPWRVPAPAENGVPGQSEAPAVTARPVPKPAGPSVRERVHERVRERSASVKRSYALARERVSDSVTRGAHAARRSSHQVSQLALRGGARASAAGAATLKGTASIGRSLDRTIKERVAPAIVVASGSLKRAVPVWRPRIPAWRPSIDARVLLSKGSVMFACGVLAGVAYTTWWARPLPASDAVDDRPIVTTPASDAVAVAVSDRAPAARQPALVEEAVSGVSETKSPIPSKPAAGPVTAAAIPVKADSTPVKAPQVPARVTPARIRTAASSAAPPPRERAQVVDVEASFRGSLSITSTPQGAQVSLNGRVVGVTPLTLANLPAGSRAVQVRLDGYNPWSSGVQVVADQQTSVRANLTRSR